MANKGTKIIKGKPISGAGVLSNQIATTSHVICPGCSKGGK